MTSGQRPNPEFLALQAAVAGRYVLDREIGRGGMGIVFLARDTALERPVAIKLLIPHLAHDEAVRTRFLREARTAAQLLHPNIVPIYAVEATAELSFFVMAYIDGESLAERVTRKGPLPPREAQRVMGEVAWALGYAHERGVIHRDVKPDNILLEYAGGRALVADFGIARVQATHTLSDDGALVGTVQYMSPEQALGESLDGRSDLYSLGSTVYFALTGSSPVEAPTIPAMLARLVQEDRPAVQLLRPDTPTPLADIVNRALSRDRESRPAGAAQLAAAVQELERSVPTVRPEIRWFIRHAEEVRLLILLGFAGSGVGIALGLGKIIDGDAVIAVVTLSLGGLVYVGAMASLSLLLRMRRQGLSLQELEQGVVQSSREAAAAQVSFYTLANSRLSVRVTGWIYLLCGASSVGLGMMYVLRNNIPLLGALHIVGGVLLGSAGGVLLKNGAQRLPWLRRFLGMDAPSKGSDDALSRGLLWLLSTRFARWFFSKKKNLSAPLVANAAPTATMLLQRVQDLVAAMPAEQRSRLQDVLPVSAALERCASELRKRLATIDSALAELGISGTGRDEFVLARGQTAERLATCISALEALRTDLLKLTAGLAQADGLTTALEKARKLGEAIDAELHGRDEVRKLLS